MNLINKEIIKYLESMRNSYNQDYLRTYSIVLNPDRNVTFARVEEMLSLSVKIKDIDFMILKLKA